MSSVKVKEDIGKLVDEFSSVLVLREIPYVTRYRQNMKFEYNSYLCIKKLKLRFYCECGVWSQKL